MLRDAAASPHSPDRLRTGREAYERYFAGLETCILPRRDDDLVVLPTRGAVAGSFLLKLRNAAGDRVVHAAEFFRANGINDRDERTFTFAWSDVRGGLVAEEHSVARLRRVSSASAEHTEVYKGLSGSIGLHLKSDLTCRWQIL